ncbi:MAG TPA: acyl-phosphate glycerol 3-phosphate acyltransferase [Gammaproteobacteria bacterium]|nr:acyl-phosphate glycerol 3-phosphate acyltransferase [Gammaproteobacteria bacterium]
MIEILIPSLILTVLAYLFGSLSSAIILCRIAGLPDPRTEGSGNPGATNVKRIAGSKLAALVLVIDIVKGSLPVLLAVLLGLSETWLALVALAAFLGHLYPIFFQFQGGKGVATALGGFIVLSPLLTVAVVSTWVMTFIVTRISSLSAIIAALLAPLYAFIWIDDQIAHSIITVMAALLLYRHRSNIQRLLAGEESRS